MGGIVSSLNTSLKNRFNVRVTSFPNTTQSFELVTNDTAPLQTLLGGLDLFICAGEIASIFGSAGAESEGSILVAAGVVATSVSTEFPCDDNFFDLTKAGLDTIAASQSEYGDTVVQYINSGNTGLSTSSSDSSPDIDECHCVLIAEPAQQFNIIIKLSGTIIPDQIPVSGTGYVFTVGLNNAWQSGPPCGSGYKNNCIVLTTANFSQSVSVGTI